jgi:hypothetical protein
MPILESASYFLSLAHLQVPSLAEQINTVAVMKKMMGSLTPGLCQKDYSQPCPMGWGVSHDGSTCVNLDPSRGGLDPRPQGAWTTMGEVGKRGVEGTMGVKWRCEGDQHGPTPVLPGPPAPPRPPVQMYIAK